MKNILVVDDEEAILVTMVEWFAAAHPHDNYNILVADNGIEAIKSLSSYKIDLLITDLNMPKMDGFELLAHVNNSYPIVPVIVMSAFDTPDIKNKVKKLGVLLFIPKPFTSEDLDAIDFDKIFGADVKRDDGKGHINGISLQSFLQLINIESKTCTLTVESQGKSGLIYIKKGDIMNAKTGMLEGNKAAQEIISWSNDGLTIEIVNSCTINDKIVTHTIMSLLMEAARMEDERSAKAAGNTDEDGEEVQQAAEQAAPPEVAPQPAAAAPVKPAPPAAESPFSGSGGATGQAAAPNQPGQSQKPIPVDLHKLDLVKIQTMLKEFAALDGFSGAVLSTSSGDILQIVKTESSNVSLEQAAIYANTMLATSNSSTAKMRIDGEVDMLQVDTKAGHMIISGKNGLNIMLILANTSSLGLGKIMASRTLLEISKQLA